MILERAEVLIVGGGIAGLSTAFHLARSGVRGVVLAEREALPGFHASGRNAGIARQLTGRPEHTALAIQGRERLAQAGLMETRGGILLGADPGGAGPLAREAEVFGLEAILAEGSPYGELKAAEHLRVAGDGIIDIYGLLAACVQGAREGGVSLRFGCPVTVLEADGAGFTVDLGGARLRVRTLVNAAGAWAGALGRGAGGLDLAFAPLRRHLAWSREPYPATRPYTWWADRPFYLRPERGGVLLCPCDEGPVDPPGPGAQPRVDAAVLAGLEASRGDLAPGLPELPLARAWAGIRTFSPDRRFVLGPDPVNPRLFWVAGLGGHGMTSGLAVGAWAARALREEIPGGALDPGRFSPH